MISSFKENLTEKIMAFVCALLLYFYVVAAKNPVMTQNPVVRVNISKLPNGYSSEMMPNEVSVRLSGPKNLLNQIDIQNLRATVAGQSLREDEGGVQVPVHLNIPEDLVQQLDISIQPATVNVRIRRMGQREMPVECLFINTPESGYVYSKPALNPGNLLVSGPSDLLKRAKRIVVSAVPSRPGAAIDEQLPAIVVDGKNNPISGLTVQPNKVRVVIALSPRQLSVASRVYPQLMGQLAEGYEVSRIIATPGEVLVSNGGESSSGNIIYTEPISVEGMSQSFTTKAKLKITAGTSVIGDDMVTVEVQIKGKAASN
ncbi:MAG: CdaR family protein [Armatimonadota bacterium]